MDMADSGRPPRPGEIDLRPPGRACGQPVPFLRNPRVVLDRPQVIHSLCPTPSPLLAFRVVSPRALLCSCRLQTTNQPATPVVLSLQPTAEGVLPGQLLERAIRAGYIDAGRFNIPDANVQPASLDLRLGERALRIRCSFLPGADSVERKLKDYILDEIDLRGDGAMLEARCPYLIELKERLDLPAGLRGKANPKSSTGRIDVFTRVITDYSDRFDEVAPGYHGPLYLEVVPLSFAVRVREDLTLNQLRLSMGRPWLTDDEVREAHLAEPILFTRGEPVPVDDLVLSNGLFLGLDLHGDERGQVGYSTRDSAPLLDLTTGGETDPRRSGTPCSARRVIASCSRPKRFYLLMSHEAVSIPPDLAAEIDRVRPDERRAPHPLRRVLRSRVRFRSHRWLPGLQGRTRGAGPRRPLHGRERAGGVQADVRAHARGADLALRNGDRIVVPAAGGDPQPVLPAIAELTADLARRRRGRSLRTGIAPLRPRSTPTTRAPAT